MDACLVSVHKVNDNISEVFAAVFLQKMSAALDGGVRLSLSAGNLFLEDFFTTFGNRIAVTEGRQKGPVELR